MVEDKQQPGYRGRLNDRCVTFAEVRKPAGYFTAMTGKWHVGQNHGVTPWGRGFERSLNAAAGGFYFGNDPRAKLFLNGANPFHGPLSSSQLDYPNKHNCPPQVYQQGTRPCSAIEVLSSSHFPEEHRGNLLVANVIGFQSILQYKLRGSTASFNRTPQARASSDDPTSTANARASGVRFNEDEGSIRTNFVTESAVSATMLGR